MKLCRGEGGLLLLTVFAEKLSKERDLELEKIWIWIPFPRFITSCWKNISQKIRGDAMEEPRLEGIASYVGDLMGK